MHAAQTAQPIVSFRPRLGSYDHIPLSEIRPSATNPRKHFEPHALDDLASSIRSSGVLQPILLRPHPEGVGYEIVAGERRFRASALAGMESIPAIVKEHSDAEAYQAQILENLQREDLSPMDEADGYGVLSGQGMSSADIAARLGKAPAYVHQRLRLLGATGDVQAALRADTIPLAYALEIAKLDPADQAATLDHCLDRWDAPKSVAQLREWIDREFRLVLAKAPFSVEDAELYPKAGACVACPKRTHADQLLFADVTAEDRCLFPLCFRIKVDRVVLVRVAEIKAVQGFCATLSESYQAPKGLPEGTLGRQRFTPAEKPYRVCRNSVKAVWADGERAGHVTKICVDTGCDVHGGMAGNSVGGSEAERTKRLNEQRKQKLEATCRVRIAGATAKAILDRPSDLAIDAEDALLLSDYAFRRMEHIFDRKLCEMIGWDQGLMGWGAQDKRAEVLAELGTSKAAGLGVLASCIGELTVGGHGQGGELKLEVLARRKGVEVSAIREAVHAEAEAKAKKKAGAKSGKKLAEVLADSVAESPVPPPAKEARQKPVATKAPAKSALSERAAKLSPEARKRIADAMKRRWADKRKTLAKPAAKKAVAGKAVVRKTPAKKTAAKKPTAKKGGK